jgi:hypothetical protein
LIPFASTVLCDAEYRFPSTDNSPGLLLLSQVSGDSSQECAPLDSPSVTLTSIYVACLLLGVADYRCGGGGTSQQLNLIPSVSTVLCDAEDTFAADVLRSVRFPTTVPTDNSPGLLLLSPISGNIPHCSPLVRPTVDLTSSCTPCSLTEYQGQSCRIVTPTPDLRRAIQRHKPRESSPCWKRPSILSGRPLPRRKNKQITTSQLITLGQALRTTTAAREPVKTRSKGFAETQWPSQVTVQPRLKVEITKVKRVPTRRSERLFLADANKVQLSTPKKNAKIKNSRPSSQLRSKPKRTHAPTDSDCLTPRRSPRLSEALCPSIHAATPSPVKVTRLVKSRRWGCQRTRGASFFTTS